MLMRFGGACIAHDARMLGFYCILLGHERALSVASKELGRPVTEAEMNLWLGDESKMPVLFLSEIAVCSAPTIIHSAITAREFEALYGVAPSYLPFSIYRPWSPKELAPACRKAARDRLGLATDEVVVATFGFVQASKAPVECVWVLDLLRSWGIPASLHFVGTFDAKVPPMADLRRLMSDLGLEAHVRLFEDYVSEQVYRDYLLAADVGLQLRKVGFGSISGALMDCAAAGLPTVANTSLAMALGVPEYVHSVPDMFSPVLVAEALADLLTSGLAGERPEHPFRAYSAQRSAANYARGLCRALMLDIS
jgi:glycosyltransferase involved in cell wall biosynthesis